MITHLNFKSWPYAAWFVLCLITLCVIGASWALTSSKSILLSSAGGADWIRLDQPFELGALPPDSFAVFSCDYVASNNRPSCVLKVMALRRFVVLVDGKKIFDNGVTASNWRNEYEIDFSASCLTAGSHKLKLMVANKFGPAMIRADCAELGIRTGAGWRASADQHNWSPAANANQPWEPAVAGRLPTAASSVIQALPVLIIWCVVGGAAYLLAIKFTAGRVIFLGWWVKWAVLLAWFVLGVHNIFQLPAGIGYDVRQHLEYVHYVADNWRIPLPTDGIEMYHPPLYYLLSAVLYKIVMACGATLAQADMWLRVIPLACGAAMVEISYRAARVVFPRSEFQQGAAAVIGGLLPMNIYMAQAVSNEPLAAVLGGIVMLICLHFLVPGKAEVCNRRWLLRGVFLGMLLGFAVLAKVTGLIWVGIAAGVLVCAILNQATVSTVKFKRIVGAGMACFVLLLTTAMVCGWYFWRNNTSIGMPFLTHAALGGNRWWQFPGYRSPAQLFTFGRSLVTPAYGDLTGFWDDLYSTLWSDGMLNGVVSYPGGPPWDYEYMACGLWLSLGLMGAMFVGTLPWRETQRVALRFAFVCIIVFVFAMLYQWLTWPIYSTVKASYLLSLSPCLALLGAAGFGRLAPNRLLRTVSCAFLMCWAMAAYATYFI